MKEDVVPFAWRIREEPLEATAAAALGPAVRGFVTRLLAREDEALARLRGVVANRGTAVVVLGETRELPWFDGVRYLGRDARAPSLLVPTLLEPDVPIELVERALLRRTRDAAPASLRSRERANERPASPLAVFPDVPSIVPCGPALPIVRRRLVEALRA